MANLTFSLSTDASSAIDGISQVDKAQQQLATGAREYEKDSKKAYDEAGKGSKKLADETEGVIVKQKSLKAQLRELKAELANATDPKEIIRLSQAAGELEDRIGDASDAAAVFATDSPFEAVGNAIGSVGQKILSLDFAGAADQSRLLVAATQRITLKDTIASVKQLGTTFLNLGKALLLNPLFLIGGLIAGIVFAVVEFKDKVKFLGEIFDGIGAIITKVTQYLKDFADYLKITTFASDEQAQRIIDNAKKTEAALSLRYDREIKLAQAAGKSTTELEIKKQKAVQTSVLSQIEQLKKLAAANSTTLEARQKAVDDIDALKKIYLDAGIEIAAQQLKVDKEAADNKAKADKEAAERIKKAREDLNAALLDISKRAQAAELDSLSGLEKINKQKELSDKELSDLRDLLIKKQALAGKGNQLSAEQQEQFNQFQLAIDRKYGTDTLALDIQLAEQKAQVRLREFQNRKKDAEDAKAFADLQTEIRLEEINSLKKPQGLSDEDFEKQKAVAILEVKKQASSDQLKVRIEQVRAETGLLVQQANNEASILEAKGDAESLAQAERLRSSINQIQISGDEQEKLITLQTENLITGLNKEISDINSGNKIDKVDWGKIFGLTDEDKKNISLIGDQLKGIAQGFIDNQNQKLDNEIELIEKGKEARQNEIDDIESKLKDENALRDAGYANNAAQLDQQLADKKRAQDEDLENTKKLQKEKERLRKQQLLLDQAQQASSLVTAIAEIYASTASAGPFGVAIAAITIGAMLGAFAYAQGRASAAVNAADSSFWKGGYVGDGDKYEEMGTVHGGEFVTTKEKTKKHRTLLEGLHSGDHNMIRIGISDLLKDTGVGLMGDIPGQLNLTKQALKQSEINLMLKSNNEGMEKRIDNLGSKFDKVVSALNNSEVVLPNGNRIIKKGDLTTIIKPNGN